MKEMILVVEDNPDMTSALKLALEMEGYQVLTAADGLEALRILERVTPDLILADVMMPEMDGLALCRAIKGDPRLSHIPVVLLTARATEEAKIEGLKAGADDYLYKPFSAEEVQTRIENLIEIRRQLHERFSREVTFAPTGTLLQSDEEIFLEHVRKVVGPHLLNDFPDGFFLDSIRLDGRQSRVEIGKFLQYHILIIRDCVDIVLPAEAHEVFLRFLHFGLQIRNLFVEKFRRRVG